MRRDWGAFQVNSESILSSELMCLMPACGNTGLNIRMSQLWIASLKV